MLDGDFEITYPYASDQVLLTESSVPNKSQAIETASSFLSRGSKLTDDLKNGDKNEISCSQTRKTAQMISRY